MIDSAQDVNELPSFLRQIEIRLGQPAPRVRYEKGRPIREPSADMDRVLQAIEHEVTAALQAIYGTQTAVRLTVARTQDIRLSGTFSEKAGVVRERVGDILGQALENLDLGAE
ncbi:hypothetical protein [Deinococcus navajonensis]|uniref:Uncharacterized protein n=1 Tax=Deinococcus navajonensis TaxID=309884 RepID=A0ABV8XRG7_9DEIO